MTTPIKTANAHPVVITIHPEFFPLVPAEYGNVSVS
jgi:hypothetical protein